MRDQHASIAARAALAAIALGVASSAVAITRPVAQPQEVTLGGNALALGAAPVPGLRPEYAADLVDRSQPRAAPVGEEVPLGTVPPPMSNPFTGSSATAGELSVKPGRNQVVQVSRNQLNRFVTPFAHPVIKTTSTTTTSKVEGQIAYVATSSNEPVGIFIVDEDNPVNAISLTLMPRDIQPVSVNLQLEEYAFTPAAMGNPAAAGFGPDGGTDSFVSMLRETFRAIASGEVPRGYGIKRTPSRNSNMPECLMPGLAITPAQEISNGQMIIVVSKVTNRTAIPQTVDEQSCATDQVLAVAAWPYVDLAPGQSTELYVALRRSAPPSHQARPSVL